MALFSPLINQCSFYLQIQLFHPLEANFILFRNNFLILTYLSESQIAVVSMLAHLCLFSVSTTLIALATSSFFPSVSAFITVITGLFSATLI